MLGANGVVGGPLCHGVVYCNNNAVYGHGSVAPIVNVLNSFKDEIVVRYASRQDNLSISMGSSGNANTVRIAPGNQALLVDLIPGSPGIRAVTFVTVEQVGKPGFDVYSLVFTPSRGYYFLRAPAHFQMDAFGSIVKSQENPQTAVSPTKPIFPLEYGGCQQPDWPWALVYSVTFYARPSNPKIESGPDCQATADWAVLPPLTGGS